MSQFSNESRGIKPCEMEIIARLEDAHREGKAAFRRGESIQSCIYMKQMLDTGNNRILRLKHLMWCNGWGKALAETNAQYDNFA